jgi:hypothetical protein
LIAFPPAAVDAPEKAGLLKLISTPEVDGLGQTYCATSKCKNTCHTYRSGLGQEIKKLV